MTTKEARSLRVGQQVLQPVVLHDATGASSYVNRVLRFMGNDRFVFVDHGEDAIVVLSDQQITECHLVAEDLDAARPVKP